MGYRGRDVEVVFAEGNCIVTACDSCGAIGEKELDVVKVPAYSTGRFTTRVALFEVLATGALPRIATAAISNEPVPTGENILKGVRDELKQLGSDEFPLAISCEKNMPTQQTGLGVTVIGVGVEKNLRIARTRTDDYVYCLGLPKVGPEVQSPDDPQIVQLEHIRLLLEDQRIHDIIPVGSRGISGEIAALAETLEFSFELDSSLDSRSSMLHKSGGPSTCILFTAEQGSSQSIVEYYLNCFPKMALTYLGNF